MAKRFLKTNKTINKVLAGAGIAALVPLGISMIAPAWANSPVAKVAEGVAAYGVGGVESLVGAGVTMLVGQRAARGARSLDNTMTESL